MLKRPNPLVLTRSLCRAGDVPRGDVFLPPVRELPVRTTAAAEPGQQPAWEFVAAHGGSGAGLLARLSAWQPIDALGGDRRPRGGRDPGDLEEWPAYAVKAGRAWPDPTLEPTELVIVVCQTTMRGLGWARDAAAQYLAGRAPAGLRLLGLVTVTDQPGRLPPPLAAARNLLTGAYPHTWHVPYVPAYRLLTGLPGEHCPPIHPAVADVLAAIRCTVTPTSSKGQRS